MENNIVNLNNLIEKGESEELAFLPNYNQNRIGRDICSLLNGKGGKLIVGVDTNGQKLGINKSASVEDTAHFLVNAIVPEAPVDITLESYDDKDFMIIRVWEGSRQPYIYDGSIYYRRNISTEKASSQEIAKLIHSRQENELHWERQVSFGLEWEDFNQSLIEEVMQTSQKNRRSSYHGNDLLGFLNHYGLFNNGSFTNACVILFAKNTIRFLPQIRVRLTEYAEGKTDKSLIRDELVEGNLFQIRDRLENYIQNIGVKSLFEDSRWRRIDFTYPEKALQEGIINALIHRDYSRFNSQMTISIYPDKLIIANSGRLPEELRIADLKTNHRSFPMNPDIAHIVFLMGFIDKLGRGTVKIMEECKLAGLRMPTWSQGKGEVILTFHAPKVNTNKEAITVGDAVSKIGDTVNKAIDDTVNDALNDAVSDTVKARLILVVKLIYVVEPVTLKTLMNSLNISRATIQRDLQLLNSHHFLSLIGSDKFREYKINDALKNKFDALKM